MSDKKEKKDKESPESWWGLSFLVLILILGIDIWLLWPEKPPAPPKTSIVAPALSEYPLCAGPERYDFNDDKEIIINIHSNCWSGIVSIPSNKKFRVHTAEAGDLEYKFWDGRRVLVPNKQAVWLGNISQAVFRLRGIGKAEITIEN